MPELNFDDMYGSKYLGVADLKDGEPRCTIRNVEVAELKDKAGTVKHKYVLEFDELPKSLVLNRTNARKLAEAWGKKSHSWIGQRVTLYGEDTSFGPGVRLRPVKVQKPLADDMNDEIPNL
jgi:hypothetical protein